MFCLGTTRLCPVWYTLHMGLKSTKAHRLHTFPIASGLDSHKQFNSLVRGMLVLHQANLKSTAFFKSARETEQNLPAQLR
jgi:hypothetical protein